jgi:hypothetical protein
MFCFQKKIIKRAEMQCTELSNYSALDKKRSEFYARCHECSQSSKWHLIVKLTRNKELSPSCIGNIMSISNDRHNELLVLLHGCTLRSVLGTTQ